MCGALNRCNTLIGLNMDTERKSMTQRESRGRGKEEKIKYLNVNI